MKFVFALISVIFLSVTGNAIHTPIESDSDGRIIATTPSVALPGQFPYIASVHAKAAFQCGGAIISVKWVLTAANCVSIFTPSIDDVKVRVGGITQGDGAEPGRDEIRVSEIHPHNEFVSPGPENNIALLYLERNIVFNNLMQPVSLANPGKPIDMSVAAIVMGWGGSTGPAESQLQYNFNFALMDLLSCQAAAGIVVPNAICTDGTLPNPSTCYLDQGGPLLQFDSTLGTVLYGITSFSLCGVRPTFYESITHHRMWIYTVSNV